MFMGEYFSKICTAPFLILLRKKLLIRIWGLGLANQVVFKGYFEAWAPSNLVL